jgi:DNA polymerase I-like protein with 3'-5' exonuclease and polymerase domains
MIYFISNQARWQSSFASATIEDVIEFCQKAGAIAVDTETTGLNYIDGHIIMLQIGNETDQFVIDARNVDILPLKEVLESRTIVKYLQNVKFDYKFFRRAGITLENTVDTMLQEQIIVNGKQFEGFSLAVLVSKYMGIQLDKSTRIEFSNWGDKEFTDKQIIYGADDVKYLISISDLQEFEAERYNLGLVLKLENSAALAAADISYNGMAIETEKWLAIASTAKEEARAIEMELDAMVISDPALFETCRLEAIQQDLWRPIEELRKIGVNWSSPLQVVKLFQSFLPSLENVNSDQISPFRFEYPVIDRYITYKEYDKRASSYGEAFLENIASDGRIHTDFKQILVTGRMSSSNPNMQQIPGSNLYRNCFIPGYPDWVFVSADYASQELALIAFASKDPVWLKALETGQDLHSVCAELVFGDEWMQAAEVNCAYYLKGAKVKCDCKRHKKLRQSVKEINFGLAYGMTEMKLSSKLRIEPKQAAKLINDYFKIFPSIKEYLDACGNFGKQKGYIRTLSPWGRMRWFADWQPRGMEWGLQGSIERESKNTPIQGAGADMVKYALIQIRNYIRDNKVPVKLVMQVHDQIDTICPKDYAPQWRVILKELMEKAAILTIPSGLLKAEVNISLVWEK